MIVFGTNDFRIGSFDPYELDLEEHPNAGYRIEARQKHFHIFWIPVMPLDIIWIARVNGKRYKLPPEKENYLELNEPFVKTPWYSYAFPILIALLILFIYLSSHYTDYRRSVERRKRLEKVETRVKNPKFHDVYKFLDYESGNYILTRVVKSAKDSTLLEVPYLQYLSDRSWSTRFKYAVSDTSKAYKLVWVRKTVLVNSILKDVENRPAAIPSPLAKGWIRLDYLTSESGNEYFYL